jgi:4-hydroxybenzoate polyprenyltransferase
MSPLRYLAASARIANLPSVISNVWMGIAIAAGHSVEPGIPWSAINLIFCGILLCLGGNFLNDWADREWDAKNRPERALPRMIFPASLYFTNAITCLVIAALLAVAVSSAVLIVALAISACILLYTWSHKRSQWSVIPMALCRGLLPVLGLTACSFPQTYQSTATLLGAACGLGLFLHTLGISLNARLESTRPDSAPARLSIVLFPLAAAFPAIAGTMEGFVILSIFTALLPYAVWTSLAFTRFRQPVSKRVSALLAGFPLVDYILLFPMAILVITCSGPSPFALACLMLSPITFFSAKGLQRLAPAT